jgi:hypothetical protein
LNPALCTLITFGEGEDTMRLLLCSLFIGFSLALALAQSSTPTAAPAPAPAASPILSAAEAAQHVGENRTVCGEIVNTYTATSSHGTPTFVDIDQPYPHSVFDLVIWGDNKNDIGHFPDKGKICASGSIILYKGKAEIQLRDWHGWYVPSDTQQRASVP